MNILTIVHQFLPKHAAGSEHYTYYLAKELVRRGHRLHLYFTEIDHAKPHASLRSGEYDGLPFFEAINNHAFPTLERTYRDAAMEANLRTVLDAVRPDVVHVQHLHLHSIGYVDILKDRQKRILWTLHEYLPLCLRHGQLLRTDGALCQGPEDLECANCARLWPPPEGAALPGAVLDELRQQAVGTRRRAMQAALSKVDLFVAPSSFLRDMYVACGFIAPERIEVSDYGFAQRPAPARRRAADGSLRLGFLGTIADWKGVHLIVEAFNGLPERGLECRIYGDLTFLPDYSLGLRRARRHVGVRFLGAFDNRRVAEILAEIDVLIVPSIWFENSPLTIHEAFLAGVPVLCSDRGGMAELVADGVSGLHFRMGDARDLRAKIVRLSTEPALLETLRRGIPPVKDIEEDARQTEARLERLAGPRA